MTSPISWSRLASVLVSDAVLASRLWMVPPSPCSVRTMFIESSLTVLGSSAEKSGLKPLNSTVRSRAGLVCVIGMVPSFFSRGAPGLPCSRPR